MTRLDMSRWGVAGTVIPDAPFLNPISLKQAAKPVCIEVVSSEAASMIYIKILRYVQ